MKIEDVKIGDPVKVLMTGSYHTTVVDINETQIMIGSECGRGGWFDRDSFFIAPDVNVYEDPTGKPDILCIRQGDMYYQHYVKGKND